MEKIEETIKEIAVKHGIAIGRDDQIMILHTINERLMKETAAAQQQILHEFKEELESAAHAWETNAKSISEKILNTSLIGVKETIQKVLIEEGKRAGESINRDIEAALTQLNSKLRVLRIVASVNVLAAVSIFFTLVAILSIY